MCKTDPMESINPPVPVEGQRHRTVLVLCIIALGLGVGITRASAEPGLGSDLGLAREPSALPTSSPADPSEAGADSLAVRALSVTPLTEDAAIAFNPPEAEHYALAESEIAIGAKSLAVRVAEKLTNYSADSDLGTMISGLGGTDAFSDALEARHIFHANRASRGQVVYPQMGGLTEEQASVMVVVRQTVWDGEAIEFVETRTLDIRVRLDETGWVFEGLASAGGDRLARPETLSAEATAVLDNPRIFLPDSARWDIYRGQVSRSLLALLDDISEKTPFGVVTLTNGHPHNVFGTERLSAHTTGHAVDLFRLGDSQVIESRYEGSLVHSLASLLYRMETVKQVGSPWNFDGPSSRSFTNTVHQDHIHVAVAP